MRILCLVFVCLLALPGAGDPHQLNSARRQVRFAQGRGQGADWMLECRDMWNTTEDDGGVYFQCATSRDDAKKELREILAHPDDVRLLGIYDLKRELRGQGPGMTAEEFLRDRAR